MSSLRLLSSVLLISLISADVATAEVDLNSRYCHAGINLVETPRHADYCQGAVNIGCQLDWERQVQKVSKYNTFARRCLAFFQRKPDKPLPQGAPSRNSGGKDQSAKPAVAASEKDVPPSNSKGKWADKIKKAESKAQVGRDHYGRTIEKTKESMNNEEELMEQRIQLDRDLEQQREKRDAVQDRLDQEAHYSCEGPYHTYEWWTANCQDKLGRW